MIIKNPLLNDGNRRGLIPDVVGPSVNRPADQEQARTWQSLSGVVAALFALLGLFEFHIETISAVAGTRIPHNLRRRPFGRVILWQEGNRTIFDDYEKWTKEYVTISCASGTVRACFVLF